MTSQVGQCRIPGFLDIKSLVDLCFGIEEWQGEPEYSFGAFQWMAFHVIDS